MLRFAALALTPPRPDFSGPWRLLRAPVMAQAPPGTWELLTGAPGGGGA